MSVHPAERADEAVSCRWTIDGMDCADCARTIESSVAGMPGVRSAVVNFGLGRLDVELESGSAKVEEVAGRVGALGYRVTPVAGRTLAVWTFDVAGMDCGDCARTIEAGVRHLPGVADAIVNFGAGTMQVEPGDGRLTRGAVMAAVADAGYRATVRGESSSAPVLPWWRKRRVIETGLALVLWLAGFALEHSGSAAWQFGAPYLLATALAGYPVARAAWFALKARRPDMNLLMTIAALGALAIGEWEEGASVLILFSIGLLLQSMTLDRTRHAIQALLSLTPREATVRRGGFDMRVPVEEVDVGESVFVLPGERVPVDGRVLSGRSAVDQSTITGESVPVEVEPGSVVFAGSINGDGAVTVEATKAATDSTLARIIELVEHAQGSRAPAQAFVDRFAAVYTPIVVGVAVLLATVVPAIVGDWRDWFFRALVLLVVACPCALVISTPVALVASIGSASRRGVLFKGGSAIEALAGVRTVAFDKTGTLTEGRPAVVTVRSFGRFDEETLLARAAAVESGSSHPIAAGIVHEARKRALSIPRAIDAEGFPGRGAAATVGAERVTAGNRRLFGGLPDMVERALAEVEAEGATAVLVGSGDTIDGLIGVVDPVRPAAAGVMQELDRLGVRTVMLTGDNEITAHRIAAQAGVADVRARLLPEEKVDGVRSLQAAGAVAMIGDGVNDAPALATADVGIAMGVAGTDVAIEAADVALIRDDLRQLPRAIMLARATLSIIRQNIAFSLATKGVFLALTAAGVTNLWLAVLADMGTSLLVTANSLRLAREPGPRANVGTHAASTHPDR